MYKNRKVTGVLDGVTWEMPDDQLSELVKAIQSGKDEFATFASFISSELSTSSDAMNQALENDVLSKEFFEKNEPVTPSQIKITHLDYEDGNITFSVVLTWNDIPVNAKVKNDDDFLEACDGWPTDLLDILWLNDEGLELAPDMEEVGIDNKSISIE